MPKNNYLIGTRGSLLAVTQCSLLKEEIESLANARFELVKIKTEGDQKTDKPLWQLDGKDFFTKELDAALLKDEIDMVVHSYKDLGSERPAGLELAAVGKRRFAHDIFLIKKETLPLIETKKEFIVGTSSPRRITNVEASLKPFLPKAPENLKVKCKMLRGNVNTRIQKLLDGAYDGIVLALAGLERLASKEESQKVLAELTKDLTFLIMPQKTFPSSASQGALAVEIHDQSPRAAQLREILSSIHSPETVEEVKRERKAFNSYGGGCHLAVGIHVKKIKDLYAHIHQGVHDNKVVRKIEIEGQSLDTVKDKKAFFALGENDPLVKQTPLRPSIKDGHNLFVTSHHCFDALKEAKFNSLWAAGSRTHKKLAKLGYWVNGSADSFGHEEIMSLKESKAAQIMLGSDQWSVLSHDKASSPVGEVVPCYGREVAESAHADVEDCDVFYWGSFFQYQVYTRKYPWIKDKIHACGLGKTYDSFVEHGIKVFPVADMAGFKAAVRENQ